MTSEIMNGEQLQALILSGEGQLLEFKRSGTSHLGREICAFANSIGGKILIGVADDGTVVPPQRINALKSEVHTVARNIEPPLMVNVEVVDGVLIVDVPASRSKPHSSSGKFYLREGATCQQMNRDEIRDFFYREGLIYFDEKINERYRFPDDLNHDTYTEFIETCGISSALEPRQLLTNLGLLKKKGMTYAGSLLLGKSVSRLVPGASVNCCLFQGTTKTRILDQKVYDGDFLSNYHNAVNYLVAHLNTAYEIGFERKERMELPEGALREALLNAMGHRDYRVPGDLQVHIFHDRVEISNPGGLVGGLTLETLGTRSIPRNPLLFDMMLRMDLVEKVGSGLKRIRAMCEEYPCQHKIYADHDWFSMTFLRASTKLNTKAVPEVTPQVTPQVAPQVTPQVMLLLEAAAEPQSAAYLQKILNLKDRVHFLKSYVEPLLEIAWIERTIPDKPRSSKQKYRLTKKGFQVLNNETNNE